MLLPLPLMYPLLWCHTLALCHVSLHLFHVTLISLHRLCPILLLWPSARTCPSMFPSVLPCLPSSIRRVDDLVTFLMFSVSFLHVVDSHACGKVWQLQVDILSHLPLHLTVRHKLVRDQLQVLASSSDLGVNSVFGWFLQQSCIRDLFLLHELVFPCFRCEFLRSVTVPCSRVSAFARQHLRSQCFVVDTFPQLLCCDDCGIDRVVALSFSPLQSSREFRLLGSHGGLDFIAPPVVSTAFEPVEFKLLPDWRTSRGCLCCHPQLNFLNPSSQIWIKVSIAAMASGPSAILLMLC